MKDYKDNEKTLYAVPIDDSSLVRTSTLPKFLRYVIGTKEEIRMEDIFPHNSSPFSAMRDITDRFSDVASSSERLYTKGQIAEIEIIHRRSALRLVTTLERSGSIAYFGGSLCLTMIEPFSGITLLADSILRLGRTQFRNDPPVGIVGTIREGLYSKNVQKIDE